MSAMTNSEEDIHHEIDERLINEYKVWEEKVSSLYDLVVTHALEVAVAHRAAAPRLGDTWGKDYYVQKMILGTGTFENEPNYLMLAQIQLPLQERLEISRFGCSNDMNPYGTATKTVSTEVHVFGYRRHPSKPPLNGACNPDLRSKGYNIEGYGLSWNVYKQGQLLSGSDEAQICL